MAIEEFVPQLDTSTSRRTVVKTGAKLAYAVPVVAASFRLSATGAGAGAVSGGNCANFVLSGGPNITDSIGVDDDLFVFLDGVSIFADNDGVVTIIPPITFAANPNAALQLQIRARDTFGDCESLTPLFLFCRDTGAVQVLDLDGFPGSCDENAPAGNVFFDETFTITL